MLAVISARHSNSVARRELAEFLQMIITTGITFDGNDFAPPWDFAGSFTFAVTVVTTVGKIVESLEVSDAYSCLTKLDC